MEAIENQDIFTEDWRRREVTTCRHNDEPEEGHQTQYSYQYSPM